MKWIAIASMYLGFFGCLGFAVYHLNSGYPLWGLLLTPLFQHQKEGME